MDKTNQTFVGGVLILFIGVIIALAFFPIITNSNGIETGTFYVTNQTFNITNAYNAIGVIPNSTSLNAQITLNGANVQGGFSNIVLGNQTRNTTQGTDWIITEPTSIGQNGVIQVLNSSVTNGLGNGSLISVWYNYNMVGYAPNNGSQAISGLIAFFAALAIIIFAMRYSIIHWIKPK
jgi:hypothetical protein